MSLIPLPTSMLGKNPFLPESAAIFGSILFMASLSFSAMRRYATRKGLLEQKDEEITEEVVKVGKRIQLKNYIGLACYASGAGLAYVSSYISFGLYLIPTALFFIPDGVQKASDDVDTLEENEKGASG